MNVIFCQNGPVGNVIYYQMGNVGNSIYITRVLWNVIYYKKGTGFSLGAAPKSCIWTESNILRKTNYWCSLVTFSVPGYLFRVCFVLYAIW